MEEAAQGEAEVKDDAAEESGSERKPDVKTSLPRRKPNKDVAVRLSVGAFRAKDKGTHAVVDAALARAEFAHLAALQRYLGCASERHALTWLSLRTQAFTVVD